MQVAIADEIAQNSFKTRNKKNCPVRPSEKIHDMGTVAVPRKCLVSNDIHLVTGMSSKIGTLNTFTVDMKLIKNPY